MDVLLIVMKATGPGGGEIWVESAWDEESIYENESGYAEDLRKAESLCQDAEQEFRVVRVSLDWDAVRAAFGPVTVRGEVKGEVKP